MPKKKFDKAFKLNAVALVLEQDLTMVRVSQDLGIGLSTLQRWVKEVKHQGKEQVFPGTGRYLLDQAQLRELKREVEILRRERDILKKALAIFSSP